MTTRTNTLRFLKRACLALGLSTGVAASVLAYQGGGWEGDSHRGARGSIEKIEKMALHRAKHLSRMVDASEAQKSKLETIAKTNAKESQPLWAALLGLKKQRMQLLAAPQIDLTALAKVEQEIDEQQASLRKIMNKVMLDTALILTPEQRAKLLKMKKRGRGNKHDSE